MKKNGERQIREHMSHVKGADIMLTEFNLADWETEARAVIC